MRHSEALPEPTRLTLSCTEDLVALVPYLLGYVPDERLAVVVVDRGWLALTLSVELAEVARGDRSRAMVLEALDRFEDPSLLAVAHSADPVLAETVLGDFVDWAGDRCLLDAVTVGPDRWWSWFDPSRGGDTAGLAGRPAALEAVVAGLRTEPNRDAVARLLDGPGTDDALAARHQGVHERWSGRPRTVWLARAVELQSICLQTGWGADELTELAVLARDRDVVDRLWLVLDERGAPAALPLWLDVVAQAPDGWEAGAVLMAGFCAWLAGNGVLHVAAVERLAHLCPDDESVRALDALNRHAVPPRAWARVRAHESLMEAGARAS